jgi:dihydrofolate reductase
VRLARVMGEKPKYVVSSSEPGADWQARRMDAGPTLARSALDWNLVDEYHVAISPIVAGRGPTFLAGLEKDRQATLMDVDRLRSGLVINRYRFGT